MDSVLVSGFAGYEEVEAFGQLIEYATRGRVIVGWETDDDFEPEDPDDEGLYPIYDETDRSGDPRYPLAYWIANLGCSSTWGTDTPVGLGARFPFNLQANLQILQDAADKTDLRIKAS